METGFKWIPDNFKGILAATVIVSSFAYFFIITFYERKADPQVIIAIVAAMSNVLQYYFGSSQGANKKDELIATMNASPTPVATTNSGDINVDNKIKEKGE